MLEVPPLPDAYAEADWAEMSCLLGKKSTISRLEIEVTLEEAGVDNPEIAIGDIWQQIDWRHSISPNRHPIVAKVGHLRRLRTWRQTLSYTFMLLLTCQSFYAGTEIPKGRWKTTAKLFEKLVTAAMKRFLGRAISVGYPREDPIPRGFLKCLDYVCQLTYEQAGPRYAYYHWTKDEGVDIIAWRPYDKRSGQIVMLVQCGAGKNWREKTGEIDLRTWNDLIYFAASPTKALAFPSICKDQWLRWTLQGGILLDRLRIASLAPTHTAFYLRNELIDWCNRQIAGLQWLS